MPFFKRKEFGGLMKRLRNEQGWSQDELAEKLGVSRQTIANAENGSTIPKALFVEKAYHIFGSTEFIIKYLEIQRDRKELISLAKTVNEDNLIMASVIMKRVIRDALRNQDLRSVASNLFQVVMWDLKVKGKVNNRKIDWVIRAIDAAELDSNDFYDLLNDLYHISRKSRKYEVFVRLTNEIDTKLKLDDRRLSQVLFQRTNALYFSDDHFNAYKSSLRSIRIMDGRIFQHTHHIYHRHALVCMQMGNYKEATYYSKKCLEIVEEGSADYYLEKASLARQHYMAEDYASAQPIWRELLSRLSKNDFTRTHSLNDIIMMHIRTGDLDSATHSIKECERLLKMAQEEAWPFFRWENLLLQRNKVMLMAVQRNNYLDPAVSKILNELKGTYLRDEYELTKNFILERLFS